MNQVQLTKLRPWQYQTLRWAAISAIVALTLLPAVSIANILSTTGANNLSSDDGIFNDKFLDKVLEGTYHWQDFPRDTFFNTHSLLFPGLVYLGLAYFADSNVYVAIYLGLLLAALKLLLLHSALTQTNQTRKRWERWLLWPLLAALVFSVSQISTFEHGLSTVAGGLSWLGFALGVWALTRFPGQWRGVALMAVGGVVATLSSGSGLVMWPSLLVGLMLLGFRKVWHYALWLSAAVLSAAPYVFFLVLDPQRTTHSRSTLLSPFNYLFIIATLGRPFANGINADYSSEMPIPLRIGLLGLAICFTGLVLLFQKRRTHALAQSAPALMLIAFSLLTTWQISLFRDGIPAYYTPLSMIFWIGLLGLAYVIWANAAFEPDQVRRRYQVSPLIARLWSVGVVVGLVVLYASSNFTYADKTVFLRTRSPASAACLRNYRNAPTYCEETLVVWPLGKTGYLPMLAQPLERHHLSVFAPQQEWTLQGDFILDSVRIDETPGISDIFWSADLTATPVSWRDYKHLNLFLHTPNAISWTVSLPPNMEQADFHSAIAISQSVPFDPTEDGAQFEVYLEPEGGASELLFSQNLAADQHQWLPFTIPLSAYAGQTITLRLTSSAGGNVTGDWAMYRYPYIDLRLNPAKDVATSVPSKPFVPSLTDADARFDITDASLWQTSNMRPMSAETEGARAWTLNLDPSLQFNRPLDLSLADYTHFYVRLAASPDNYPMTLQILFKLGNEPALARWITIPVFADGEMHEYTYDLKLLELDQRTRLTGVGLRPTREGSFTGRSWVKLSDFRLIRGSKPSYQGTQAQPQRVAGSLGGDKRQMTTVADLIRLANSPMAHKQPEDPVKNAAFVRVSTFTIEGDTRRVLYMHPTSAVVYTLRLPIHAHLQTSLALDPQTWQPGKGDGVEYVVYLKAADGRSHKLLDRYIDPKNILDDRKWNDLSIDLSAYGGQDITLTLTTLPGPRGDTAYDWSGWANPQIVVFQLEDSSSKPRPTKLAR